MPRRPRPADVAKAAPDSKQYVVHLDLPDPLPVTEGELDLLETELSDFVEELVSQAR